MNNKLSFFSSRIKKDSVREFIAEFIGTCTLVCLGCSANAVLTFNSKLINIAPFAWGSALTVSIYISGGVSGGHLNPAVSMGLASIGKLKWNKLGHYFLGQYLGAFFGSLLTFLVYKEKIDTMPPNNTIGIFVTFSATDINAGSAFLDQMIATMFFLIIICAIIDEKNMNISKGLVPLLIGIINLGVIIMSFEYNCGSPLNPARDLMPRILTSMAGWKLAPFSFKNYGYFWIPVIACHFGAVIGCWIYRLAISNHWEE